MASRSERQTKPGTVIAKANAKWVSYAHTLFASYAFMAALVVGMKLHFQKIVRNEYYGYPDEWFPSVSATIGDRYPERSVFQIFIAVTSGPRFALCFLFYIIASKPGALFPKVHAVIGLLRTFTCGGWVYITSTDDHDWHDIFMISYLVLTIPWTIGGIFLSKPNTTSLKYRKVFATSFFSMIVPLVYYFIQHKVHHVAGAYTIYAFFEWSLIFFDIAYDAATAYDFGSLEFRIVDMDGITNRSVGKQSKSSLEANTGGFFSGLTLSGLISFFISIYNSFIFWSVLTSLGVLIWYFPLWYMGISGYEASLFSTIGAFFLGLPYLAPLLARYPQITQLGQLIGVAAYLVPGPSDRLLTVSAGVILATMSLALEFWNVTARPFLGVSKATSFSIGFILSVITKLAFYANNPIWPIMHKENGGLNIEGLILGIICAVLTDRPQTGAADTSKSSKQGCFFWSAAGVGGLIFTMHSMLSDSSTLIYWAWNGYPLTGPLPIPYGALTIIACIVGVYIGVVMKDFASSFPAYAIGVIASAGLYYFENWFGYYFSLVFSVYIMAIVPGIFEAASFHPPGRTFGVAFLIYSLLVLAHVWVVAYAFVPGGPLLRERSDIVLGISMFFIGLGVYGLSLVKKPAVQPKKNSFTFQRLKSVTVLVLTLLTLATSIITYQRFDRPDPEPYHPESKLLTAGIWTIHFGLDNDMWASEGRMRDAIRDLEIDVIGLLESDTQRIIMGNRDVTQQIAEELNMYVDYGPGPNKHTWGAALLSKFPILKSTHHLLPSPVGELAPAIHATLNVYGYPVDVVVFHSGQEEDVEDRRLQTLGISEIMAGSSNPTILLSYLVTKPLEGNYLTYVSEHTRMNDIDPSDWDRWCEYILYKDIKRVGYARVSRSTITDTEIQVGKFVVGVDPTSTNEQIPEAQVPEDMRFPTMFRGDGVRGHRYHVFDEPRYYA
ncbi:Frag1/DRAM/Sfk1 family-domain-containing protein [Dipodascopsis uninucleata]